METSIAILSLVLPSVLLGTKFRMDHGEFIEWSFGRILVVIFVAVYVVLILNLEVKGIQGIDRDFYFREYAPRFVVFFMLPGMSAALILYPKIAAEFSDVYLPLVKSDMLDYFAAIGWALMILFLVSVSILYG